MEISLDNGRTYKSFDGLTEDDKAKIDRVWNNLVQFMDDDIRESVHNELVPCSKLEFLERYLEVAPTNLCID